MMPSFAVRLFALFAIVAVSIIATNTKTQASEEILGPVAYGPAIVGGARPNTVGSEARKQLIKAPVGRATKFITYFSVDAQCRSKPISIRVISPPKLGRLSIKTEPFLDKQYRTYWSVIRGDPRAKCNSYGIPSQTVYYQPTGPVGSTDHFELLIVDVGYTDRRYVEAYIVRAAE